MAGVAPEAGVTESQFPVDSADAVNDIGAVPLLIVSAIARVFVNLDYLSLCGLLAGSMTDPPALQFATSITDSDAPSVSYATVYPLVMLLRVVGAQVLVLALA